MTIARKSQLFRRAGTAAIVAATTAISPALAQDYGQTVDSGNPATIDVPTGTTLTGNLSGIKAIVPMFLSVEGEVRGNGTASTSNNTDAGVTFDGGPTQITNAGTISGAGAGIASTYHLDIATNTYVGLATGNTITNTGTISGETNDGVRLLGGGTLTNSGTITGLQGDQTDGVSSFAFTDQAPASYSMNVDNKAGGTITGARFGVFLSSGGTVNNAGTISTIGTANASVVGAVGIQSLDANLPAGVLTNSGTIDGGALFYISDATVHNYGQISATGQAALNAATFNSLTVDGTGSYQTTGDNAPGIWASNTGAVDISASSISTNGTNSPGILVGDQNAPRTGDLTLPTGLASSVKIDSGSINAVGDGSFGIQVDAATAPVDITSNAITTNGLSANAIDVKAGGDISINSGSVETLGTGYTYAINAISYSGGNVSITSGSAIAHGSGPAGFQASGDTRAIYAKTYGGGNITINSTYAEANAKAIYAITLADLNPADGFGGNATVNSGEALSQNDRAILLQANQINLTSGTATGGRFGAIVLAAQNGITASADTTIGHGDGTMGINVDTLGDLSLTSGTVTTDGANAPGIFGVAEGGIIAIASQAVSTSGINSTGILVAPDTGQVNFNSTNYYSTAPSGTAASVAVNSGSVATTGDYSGGIRVDNAGPVSVTSQSVLTSGYNANGIDVKSSGDITIDSGAVSASGGFAYAISGVGYDGANVSITSGSAVSSHTGGPGYTGQGDTRGVYAKAYGGGDITINSGTAEGNSRGIYAITLADLNPADGFGTGKITVNSDKVTGYLGYGALLQGHQVDLTSNVATGNRGAAIAALGEIVAVKATETHGLGAGTFGIDAEAYTAPDATPGSLTLDSGTVTTDGTGATGIYAYTEGTANITSGTVTTSGDGATGIYAETGGYYNPNGDQATSLAITSGTVTTTGAGSNGIEAHSNLADITIDSGGSVTTTGDNAYGLQAASNSGNETIASTSIQTSGAESTGILASTGGNVTIVSGNIATSGAGANGIEAHLASSGTNASVTANGSVNATNGVGVLLAGDTSLSVSVLHGATVSGGATGIVLSGNTSPDLAAASAVNEGSIIGTQGPALVSGVQTSLTNSGVLSGGGGVAASLSAYDDNVLLLAGSQITGMLQGGAGIDTITLDGSGGAAGVAQQLPTLDGFEKLSVAAGTWANTGVVGSVDAVSIDQGATLQLFDASLADGTSISPLAAGSLVDNGTLELTFANSGALTYFGQTPITGTGSVVLDGTGVLELTDASGLQQTGGTTVADGALLLTGSYGGDITTTGAGIFQIGDGGTTGDFTGNLVDNGTFIFNRSDDYSLTGALSGAGAFIKNGTGTLTFGANYTFTGTTVVNAGGIAFAGQIDPSMQIQLASGGSLNVSGQTQTIGGLSGTTGSTVNVDQAVLTIAQSEDTIFSGSISGAGSLVKSGPGILRLDGVNTYTGTTTVDGGKLSVNGSIVSPVFVESGGVLGGNGTVSNVTVNSGGTVGAGNSIGHLIVAGDLGFAAGSTLQVEANSAGAADRIDVNGAITIDPTATVQVLAETGTYQPITRYTVMTAGNGISGKFGTVTSNLAFLTPLLNYSADTITLSLYRNDISLAAVAVTANQVGVAKAIQARGIGDPIYDSALVRDAATARSIYSALSGELYATTLSSLTSSSALVRDTMASTNIEREAGPFAFGSVIGGWGDGPARRGNSATRGNQRGVLAGIGYAGNGFTANLGLGYMKSDVALRGQSARSATDSAFVAGQFAYRAAGFHASLGGAYAWHRAKSYRTVDYGAGPVSLSGATNGHTGQVFADLGYDFAKGPFTFTPFARYAHVETKLNDFAETGGIGALAVRGRQKIDVLTLGGGAEARMGVARPHVSVGWRHAWGDLGAPVSVAFADGGAAFAADGLRIARNAATVDGGITVGNERFSVDLGYRGTFSKEWDDHGLHFTAAIRF